jgi:type IV pilus assembly protein PilC
MLGSRYSLDGLAMWARAVRHGHGAGLTLVRMFDMQTRNGPPRMREAAGRIAAQLQSGSTLEDALTAEGPNLPELFVSLAVVGERTGRIPEVFGQLEEYYRLQAQMRREFWSQATWPIFTFVAGVFVIALTIFIMGLLASGNDQQASPIGFGLSGTSGAILFLVVVFGSVAGAFLALKVLTSTVAKQAAFEAWLLRVPAVGPWLQSVALTRFCLALRVTLDSSMSVSKALSLSLRATGNGAFLAESEKIVKRVKKGAEISEAIGVNPIFPVEFRATLNVGEVSGQIPEVMVRQTEYYREE